MSGPTADKNVGASSALPHLLHVKFTLEWMLSGCRGTRRRPTRSLTPARPVKLPVLDDVIERSSLLSIPPMLSQEAIDTMGAEFARAAQLG